MRGVRYNGVGILACSAVGVASAAMLLPAQAQTNLPPLQVEAKKAQAKRTAKRPAVAKAKAPVPAVQAENAAKGEKKPETSTGHVDGYTATVTGTGAKGDTPLLLVPQSVSVITSDQIKDQGAQSIIEALRYTPGVSAELNSSTQYDETYIRGFSALQYLDGIALPLNQWFATPRVEPYALERIEALKGPASFIYGQTSPGGILNMISKRPTEQAQNEIALQFGSNSLFQTNFDFSGPATKDGKVLYRLTGTVRDAETEVDYTRDDNFYIAPALTWRPSADTSLTVLADYGWDKGTFPHQYLPPSGTLLASPFGRIPRNTFGGEPGWDRFDREQWAVGYEFEHKFNAALTFRQNLRYSSVDVYMQAHRIEGAHDFDGDPNNGSAINDGKTYDRNAIILDTNAGTFSVDNQLETRFATGALQHKVVVGLDYRRTTGDSLFLATAGSPIDVYNPQYGNIPVGPFATMGNNSTEQTQLGVYAQDQIKLGNWLLTLGGRQDWVDTTTARAADDPNVVFFGQDPTLSQEDSAFTGRAGLTYVFPSGIAPYVSYATSFLPVGGAGDDGLLKPLTGEQYEAGIKYQPAGRKLYMAASVFDITEQNYLTFPPGSFFGRQTGEVNVRGFEIEAKAKLTRNIDVLASYAYLDSEVTKSGNAAELGQAVPMIPLHQASIWGKYSFSEGALAGLWLGAGVRYGGSTITGDFADTIPSHTVMDLGLGYDLGRLDKSLKGAELAVNVTNVFDDYYVTGYCDSLYCSLGEGRKVLTTLRYRW